MESVIRLPAGSQDSVQTEAVVASKRWLALDLLRFVAVALMVQGHLWFVVISDAVRDQRWYGYHGYIHGFTAPLFLFSAGAAFGLTTLRRWDDHARWGMPVAKRLERYLILIGLGYIIHFSAMKLSWLMGLPPERFARVTRVDALQHIGVVLFVMETLVVIVKRKTWFMGLCATLGVVAVACAPWVWNLDVSSWPVPIAAYVNNSTSSIFPIVPWAGFIIAGLMVAKFVEHRRATVPQGWKQVAIPLALLGAGLIILGDRLAHAEWDPFPEHNFWKTSPWFFFIRVGTVISALAVLCGLEQLMARIEGIGEGRVLRFIQIIGSQTLVIYVAHLFVIYGAGPVPGFGDRWPRALGVPDAIMLTLVLFAMMAALAWVWRWTKTKHPVAFDRVRYAITFALIASLLLR